MTRTVSICDGKTLTPRTTIISSVLPVILPITTDEALLEAYKQSLLDHKLIYHNFEDFSNLKDGAKITKKFWNGKSKPVFLWGPGEGNASEWIGFVGYEIRYNGETRLRLSTFEKKFAEINKKYHKCLEVKNATRSEHLQKAIEYMESLPESLDKAKDLRYKGN